MAIKANFTRADVQRRFDAFLSEIERQQIKRLQMLGEMCVNEARTKGNYQDQTGNLRSSIGYAVFVDGMALHTMFNQIGDGSEGVKAGEALAQKVGSAHKGICLVVTAGMNYSLYVEAKGLNVITSAEHLAERELPKMLDKLVSNIQKVWD